MVFSRALKQRPAQKYSSFADNAVAQSSQYSEPMLQKKERLSRAEFNRFFSMGKRFHSPSLMLIYCRDAEFHASAVIGKKIAKTAVLRNKFRRRVYDLFGRMRKEQTFTGVFICIAKEHAQTLTYTALKEEITEIIHKTGVLR
jgi:ribonuclease P protein component